MVLSSGVLNSVLAHNNRIFNPAFNINNKDSQQYHSICYRPLKVLVPKAALNSSSKVTDQTVNLAHHEVKEEAPDLTNKVLLWEEWATNKCQLTLNHKDKDNNKWLHFREHHIN